MKSKRVTKYNDVIYLPVNSFGFGGLKGLGDSIKENMEAISTAAGGIVGSAIGDGYSSQEGNILNTVGDIGGMIPGPWGAAIGGGAKLVGGLVNRAFGTKVNQEALNEINQGTNYLSSFVSNASSFDDVKGPQTVAAVSDAYKGGWFSKGKARRKNAELRRQRLIAQDWANRSVENNIDNLVDDQMDNLLASYAAFGGPLHTHGADWTNGVIEVESGGSHESNPFEGVPMGIAPDGQPNLVEEGEVIFNDYVFSNRLRVPKAVREKYKLRGQKEMTFADAAKKAQKESEERPNDPISQRGLEDIMYRLMTEQEAIRESRQQRKYSEGGRIHIAPSKKGTFTAAASKHGMGVQEFASKVLANPEDYSPAMRKKANFARNASKWKHAKGGYLFPDGGWKSIPMDSLSFSKIDIPEIKPLPVQKITMSKEDTDLINKGIIAEQLYTPTKVRTSPLSALRFVPAIGGAIGVFSDLMGWTNKPDYSNADLVLNTANDIRDVSFNPIGDYLKYNPLDRLFYANQLGAQAGATRRSIMDTSGGNRGTAMAGLLAADYNAQNQLGNLYRQAEEYNANQRERVATFNRGTNMFNAENFLKAAMASRDNAKARVSAAAQAAAIRDAVDSRVGAARSANLTNLFDSLGNIGREAATRNMILSNPALYYSIDSTGKITYKNGYESLSDAAKDEVNRHAAARTKTRAHGGYITIRRRR